DIPYALLRDDTIDHFWPLGRTGGVIKRLILPVVRRFARQGGTWGGRRHAHSLFQWDNIILALRHYALIECGEETLAIHRLVQAITRDRLPTDERTRWAAAAVKRVRAAFSGSRSPLEPQAWPICAQYLPHAVAVVSHVSDTDNAALDTAFLLNVSSLPIMEKGEQFLRVIGIFT